MNEAPKKIIQNTFTNAAGFVYIFISNILLLPFILHSIGAEVFGSVWVVIGALTAYIGLLDLGTGTAFVKYIAQYHTQNLKDDILETITSGVVLYFVLSVLIAGTVLVFDIPLLTFVGVPIKYLYDAQFVLRVSVIIYILVGVSSPVTAVVSALQRMDITFYTTMVVQTWTIICTVIVLNHGEGVRGLILVNLTSSLISIAILAYVAKKEIPFLAIVPRYISWDKCKIFLNYGINIQISKFGQIIMFQTDRVLTLKLFGPLTTTYYDIGARLTNSGRSFTGILITALVPAVSSIDAQNNTRQLSALYIRGTKYLLITASCFFVFVSVFAEYIITVWLGEGYVSAIIITRVLSIGYFFNIITGVASSMTAGLGKTNLDRNYGIIVSISNILFVLAGAALFGSVGIAVGTTISFLTGAAYFIAVFNRSIGEKNINIYKLLFKPVFTALFCALPIYWIATTFMMNLTRFHQGIVLAFILILYGLLYIVGIRYLSLLDDYDKGIVHSIVNKMRNTVKGFINGQH